MKMVPACLLPLNLILVYKGRDHDTDIFVTNVELFKYIMTRKSLMLS